MNEKIPSCPWTARFETDVALIMESALAELTRPIDLALAEHPALSKLRMQTMPQPRMDDTGIAVLPVQGTLVYKPSAFELLTGRAEDTQAITELVLQLNDDPKVRGLVLDMNSPGGFLTGGPELAGAVKDFSKPTVAWTGGLMTSLAYMIGSQADHVMSTTSARTGSIGVLASLVDPTRLIENLGVKVLTFKNQAAKYKGAGIPGSPLTESHIEDIQSSVEKAFQMFRGMVNSTRPQITDDAMRGQTFFGADALQAGLVDQLGSLSDAVRMCRMMAEYTERKLPVLASN